MPYANVTSRLHAVPREPIIDLLRRVAPAKSQELHALIERLDPQFEVDRSEHRILFAARAGSTNAVRIGIECTRRLQAHAYAGGVLITALSTAGYATLPVIEKANLHAPIDAILTWAVGRDLQQWIKPIIQVECDLDSVLTGAGRDLPSDFLTGLTTEQRLFGEGLFLIASAFILLHELGHLSYGHVGARGPDSVANEKEADRFAATWLLDGASLPSGNRQADRINALNGIATALLWLTVRSVFLGRTRSETHPEAYDRLFQVLDYSIERSDYEEYLMVWYFVEELLFMHMHAAGFDFNAERFSADPRETVSYMIDLISAREPASL